MALALLLLTIAATLLLRARFLRWLDARHELHDAIGGHDTGAAL